MSVETESIGHFRLGIAGGHNRLGITTCKR